MPPPLETRRLLLRPLELTDAEQAQLLLPHWEIVKYLDGVVPWPFPDNGVHIFYRDKALPAVAREEAWSWSLRLKSDPTQMIGAIDLRRTGDSQRGFWLGIPWHGQGLMAEAVAATTAFWFDVLGMAELRVAKAIANTASRRISQSGGMRCIETTQRDYVSGCLPTEVWAITGEEWRRRADGRLSSEMRCAKLV
jgi:ribosomal-protein-alanine N-acetyltransferase